MHGIQHLFRQHALEKQSSTESWHSAYGGSTSGSMSSQGTLPFSRPTAERSHSVDDAGSTYESEDSRIGTHHLDMEAYRTPLSNDYHSLEISAPRSRKSPDARASLDFTRSGIKKMSKRNVSGRRSSLDSAGSPPQVNNIGFFPHDLDDIYEYKTDHQYFTHTGGYDEPERPVLSSDHHRNFLFQRNHAFHSLDEYANTINHTIGFNRYQPDNRYLGHRNRFDNSSFARKLTSSISQSSIESDQSQSSLTKGYEKHHHHRNHHKVHHHHSITEMLKTLGKKAHIWPGRTRHQSMSESTDILPEDLSKLNQNEQAEFRGRSRSLGMERTRRILDDCESTYNIYNKILKEDATDTRSAKPVKFMLRKYLKVNGMLEMILAILKLSTD